VTFKAGKAHGVQVGTHVAIYPEATSCIGKENWLTNATVTEVRDFLALARMPSAVDNPQVKEVTKKAKVVLAAPTFGGGPLPVSLIDPVSPAVPPKLCAQKSSGSSRKNNSLVMISRQHPRSPLL
jgi:hypothetical protein